MVIINTLQYDARYIQRQKRRFVFDSRAVHMGFMGREKETGTAFSPSTAVISRQLYFHHGSIFTRLHQPWTLQRLPLNES